MKQNILSSITIVVFICSIYNDSRAAAPPLVPGDVLTVNADPNQLSGVTIPSSSLGFGFYYGSFVDFFGDNPGEPNTPLIQLLQNVGQNSGAPPLRIGGVSTAETWFNDQGDPLPANITNVLDSQRLLAIRNVLQTTGGKMVMALNIGANDTSIFGNMANGILQHVLPANLKAFELGNEANRFTNRILRPAGWSFDDYLVEANTFITHYENNTSNTVPIVGPSFALVGETVTEDVEWNARIPEFFSQFSNRIGAYSFTRYPLSDCVNNTSDLRFPSIENALLPRASTGQAQVFQGNVNAAANAGLPIYVTETNTASCGGRLGTSDTFAAALWVLDSIPAYHSIGIETVHVPASSGSEYAPFKFSELNGSYIADVYPIYYGVLLLSEFIGNTSDIVQIETNMGANANAWAVKDGDELRVLLLNKDQTTSGTARVLVPGVSFAGTLARLTAPSITSTSGISLAGQSINTNGELTGTRSEELVSAVNSIYPVSMPAGSAALLRIPLSAPNGSLNAISSASTTISNLGEPVGLDGSASTGAITSYQWTQISGPSVTMVNTGQPNMTFSPTTAGTYTFQLTIADSSGAMSDETTSVVILDQVSPGVIVEDGGIAAFEAESFVTIRAGRDDFINHTWSFESDATASSGVGMVCTPDEGKNAKEEDEGPAMEYRIFFKTAGTYRVFARALGISSASDSYHVGLNSIATLPFGMKGRTTSWDWYDDVSGAGDSEITIPLAGVHTFRAWPREDGSRLDRFVLSTNPSIDPQSTPDSEIGSAAANTIAPTAVNLACINNETTLSAFYQNGTPVELNDGWILFMDTDDNDSTGYQVAGLGADAMLRNNTVFTYRGPSGWAWDAQTTATTTINGSQAELEFPRSSIGSPTNIRYLFFGDKSAFANQSGTLFFPTNRQPQVLTCSSGNGGSMTSVSVDGYAAEWTDPPIDISDASEGTNPIDVTRFAMAEFGNNVYVLYENANANPGYGDDWFLFLDTDQNASTGYQTYGIGADYVLRGSQMLLYTGSGSNWSWTLRANTTVATSGNTIEIGFSKNHIGGATSFSLAFFGNNPSDTNESLAAGATFGGGGNGIVVDGSFSDWPAGSVVGADSITDVPGAPVNLTELRVTQENGNLYVGYEHEGNGPLDNNWFLFIDSDENASTGYSVGGLGADYVIQGNALKQFTGATQGQFTFATLSTSSDGTTASTAEMSFPISALQSPPSIKVQFFGSNPGTNERFPENWQGISIDVSP